MFKSNDIHTEYFNWLLDITEAHEYSDLLYLLYSIEFTFSMPMDENRSADGINLRYRFGYYNGYSASEINNALIDEKCSVLEMIVALAVRCEENIMFDPDEGDRTPLWFSIMLSNLGLKNMVNHSFDEIYSKQCINRFLTRTYRKNGEGGLFIVHRSNYDMRKLEISQQLHMYLNELNGEG